MGRTYEELEEWYRNILIGNPKDSNDSSPVQSKETMPREGDEDSDQPNPEDN
ncbi:MAG: hypothetical protein UW79_C0013G0043 [Candidatus Yanofskybacteria bacterium GW2011_GWA2_44_9]|uniref:Uncharacterized protein n=1 Tax=Candidatus Yanofskybacteria bacterium GW2011_GWA2_44_9 TaxID=1619025 RepID=A0A0G1KDW3_9BACT|nr:MAG: hypothetical protein UW79_C0013G0043 [Candidatus Yanofskybacteria bacterium GW2011_GWA2_44_9]